jgi:hypothetical protein
VEERFVTLKMKFKKLFLTLLGGTMVFLLVMGIMFSGSSNVDASDIDIKNETLINDLRTSDSVITIDGITKSYYEEDKRVKILDDKDEVKIEMKLLTPYENKIGLNNPIAEWLLINWNDRIETFDNIISYDKNEDYKIINKVYTWKYKKVTPTEVCYDVPVNVTDSKDNLIEEENKTVEECYTHNETEWISFTSLNDLPNKNIIIGAFTDTEYGDYVEFVPTIGDFEVKEWASYLVTDLVSYYKLDETTGTTAYDAAGSNNGTISGATYTSSGKINGAYDFDGTDDYIDSSVSTSENAGTISIWISPTSSSKQNFFVFNQDSAGSANYMQFGINSDGAVYIYIANGNSLKTANSVISTNSWHHVIIQSTGTEYKVYVNKVSKSLSILSGSNDGKWNNDIPGYNHYSIGALTRGAELYTPFSGKIDEVGIWSRALSSTEVSDLYNSGDGLAYPFPAAVNCQFSGYIKDEDGNALEGANITITNQYNQSEYYNSTSSSTGAWAINVTNSTNTYMVGAYYNNTLIGQLKPYVSGTC